MSSTFYRVMRTQPPVEVGPSNTVIKNMRGDALEMTVFFVGKGEAILLRRHNKALLIDAGVGRGSIGVALGEKIADYIRNPDDDPNSTGPGLSLVGIISSHPHVDHINAAPTILGMVGSTNLSPTAKYYYNGFDVGVSLKPALDAAVKNAFDNAKPVGGSAGGAHTNNSPIVPPLSSDVTIRIAVEHDSQFEPEQKYRSIFMKLRFRKAKFIFTGDANKKYETQMLNLLPESSHKQDLLKITHHGSSDGTGDTFVEKTQPRISVASSDAASSHRLEQDVRDRLAPYGVVFDTHTVDGDIIVRTDGKRRRLDGKYGILYEIEESSPGRVMPSI